MAWYRNLVRPSPDALAVAYERPRANGVVCAPISSSSTVISKGQVTVVDPHGPHHADALQKPIGLSEALPPNTATTYTVSSPSRADR